MRFLMWAFFTFKIGNVGRKAVLIACFSRNFINIFCSNFKCRWSKMVPYEVSTNISIQ